MNDLVNVLNSMCHKDIIFVFVKYDLNFKWSVSHHLYITYLKV